MSLRAVILARVSSSGQRERNTIASQLSELPGIVAAQGWTLVETVQDDGVSGKTVFDRPGFQRVMELAEAGAFDVLVTVDTDRIGRPERAAEAAMLQDYFAQYGIKLFSPGQGIVDLTSDDSFFMTTIRLGMARLNRRKIIANTARGKREAMRKGKRFGSRDPYGLQWVPDDTEARGSYQLRPDEVAHLQRMVRMCLEGHSLMWIVKALRADGVRTRPTKPAPDGGRWNLSSIRRALRSPILKGEFTVNFQGEKRTIRVPAVVDAATWARVQVAIDKRRWVSTRELKTECLLRGIARCGVCGYAMWIARVGDAYAYYSCSSAKAHVADAKCGNRTHRVEITDAEVWKEIYKTLTSPTLITEARSQAEESVEASESWRSQMNRCAARLRELDALQAEVLGRRRRGLISAAACDTELEATARERSNVERTLVIAERHLADAKGGVERLRALESARAELARQLGEATFERRVMLIRAVVEGTGAVLLNKDGSIVVTGVAPDDNAEVAITIPGTRKNTG